MSTDIRIDGDDLIVTRVYHASRADVFDAWIETSKIKKWWGCAECVDVRSEVEPRVGGKYNHHMTIETPMGRHDAPGFATLVEYDPPRRLAYTSTDDGDPMVISVDFIEVEAGTKVRLVHSRIPDMKVEGDVELRAIIQAGWTAAFQKLGDVLSPTVPA